MNSDHVWVLTDGDGTCAVYSDERSAHADADLLRGEVGDKTGFHSRDVKVDRVAVNDSPVIIRRTDPAWVRSVSDETLRRMMVAGELESATTRFGAQGQVPFAGVLAVLLDGAYYVPSFQFRLTTEGGQSFTDLLATMRTLRWTDRAILGWFLEPESGLRRMDVVSSRPAQVFCRARWDAFRGGERRPRRPGVL